MKTRRHPKPAEPDEAEVQHTAYLLWVEAGHPAGSHAEQWLAARELLRRRRGCATRTPRPR